MIEEVDDVFKNQGGFAYLKRIEKEFQRELNVSVKKNSKRRC